MMLDLTPYDYAQTQLQWHDSNETASGKPGAIHFALDQSSHSYLHVSATLA